MLLAKSEQYSPLAALANLLHVEMTPSWIGVGVTTPVGGVVVVVVVVLVPVPVVVDGKVSTYPGARTQYWYAGHRPEQSALTSGLYAKNWAMVRCHALRKSSQVLASS